MTSYESTALHNFKVSAMTMSDAAFHVGDMIPDDDLVVALEAVCEILGEGADDESHYLAYLATGVALRAVEGDAGCETLDEAIGSLVRELRFLNAI